jgi:hypothetical protein
MQLEDELKNLKDSESKLNHFRAQKTNQTDGTTKISTEKCCGSEVATVSIDTLIIGGKFGKIYIYEV